MLVSLDGEVPEDLGMTIPDYVFWYYPQCLLYSMLYSTHMALYINEAMLLYLLVFSVPGSLDSVVDLVCHCSGVECLLLSYHDQSIGVCSVAFIEPLICAGNVCNF